MVQNGKAVPRRKVQRSHSTLILGAPGKEERWRGDAINASSKGGKLEPELLEELRDYKHSNLSVAEIMDKYLSTGGQGSKNRRLGQRELRNLIDYRRFNMDNTVHPEQPHVFLSPRYRQAEEPKLKGARKEKATRIITTNFNRSARFDNPLNTIPGPGAYDTLKKNSSFDPETVTLSTKYGPAAGMLTQREIDAIAKERRRNQYLKSRTVGGAQKQRRAASSSTQAGIRKKDSSSRTRSDPYGADARKRNAEEIQRLRAEIAAERRKTKQLQKKMSDFQIQARFREDELHSQFVKVEKRADILNQKVAAYRQTMGSIGDRAKHFQMMLMDNFAAFASKEFSLVWSTWQRFAAALNAHGYGPTTPTYEDLEEKCRDAIGNESEDDEYDFDDESSFGNMYGIEDDAVEEDESEEEDAYHALQRRADLIKKHGRHAKKSDRGLDTTLGLPQAKRKARNENHVEFLDEMDGDDDDDDEDAVDQGSAEDGTLSDGKSAETDKDGSEVEEGGDDGDDDDAEDIDAPLEAISSDTRVQQVFQIYSSSAAVPHATEKDGNAIDSGTFALIVRDMGLLAKENGMTLVGIDGLFRNSVKSQGSMRLEDFSQSLRSLAAIDDRENVAAFLDVRVSPLIADSKASDPDWIRRLLLQCYRPEMLLLLNGTHLYGLQMLYTNLEFYDRASFKSMFVAKGLVHDAATRFRRESAMSASGTDAFLAHDSVEIRGSLSSTMFDELWQCMFPHDDGSAQASLSQFIELLVNVVLKVYGDPSHHKKCTSPRMRLSMGLKVFDPSGEYFVFRDSEFVDASHVKAPDERSELVREAIIGSDAQDP